MTENHFYFLTAPMVYLSANSNYILVIYQWCFRSRDNLCFSSYFICKKRFLLSFYSRSAYNFRSYFISVLLLIIISI